MLGRLLAGVLLPFLLLLILVGTLFVRGEYQERIRKVRHDNIETVKALGREEQRYRLYLDSFDALTAERPLLREGVGEQLLYEFFHRFSLDRTDVYLEKIETVERSRLLSCVRKKVRVSSVMTWKQVKVFFAALEEQELTFFWDRVSIEGVSMYEDRVRVMLDIVLLVRA